MLGDDDGRNVGLSDGALVGLNVAEVGDLVGSKEGRNVGQNVYSPTCGVGIPDSLQASGISSSVTLHKSGSDI